MEKTSNEEIIQVIPIDLNNYKKCKCGKLTEHLEILLFKTAYGSYNWRITAECNECYFSPKE